MIPIEIKQIIIKYICPNKLINQNDTIINPIIDEHIKNYITNDLLKNLCISSYLMVNSYYKQLIKDKLKELALYYTKEFIKQCEIYSNNSVNNTSVNIISFNITFKFVKVGKYFNGSTDDTVFRLSNVILDNNICNITFYNSIRYIDNNEEYIKNELYKIFIRHLSFSDTMHEIKSMDMCRTNFPYGINNHDIYNNDILKVFI